ncbi:MULTISPECIES: heavy metal translocating P-type ATPase [Micrococcaceae]|uniref:Cd2+/Zn2+-exporting ATPase n=1 Tax=Pseudarthrobacter enclensis TaxID=993070 RepID=A0ABT9S062_9MICC|nr:MULTISPECIES: heavy metal translocating P-type ATPase [Micrococcaceae]MDP9890395.1 Cd2+/Zn2+-exporting ATPase [Pseudarthrobacter enclensis]UKA73487.1 heavy metal translocating P-type ATPase [Arthrobacter sp. FW306-06-A]WJH26676.1 heavy metal translocating P-type ATPase [Pseudarthrobacter defluvii]
MAIDTQLDLKTVLPEALDEQDACVRSLTEGLQARQGVIDAHVKRPDGAEAAQLCVHFEPGLISLGRIRELAVSLGARVDSDFGHLSLDVDGISRSARAQLLEQRLRELDGVAEAHVSATGSVTVEYLTDRTSEKAVLDLLARFGTPPRAGRLYLSEARHAGAVEAGLPEADAHDRRHEKQEEHDHKHGGIFSERSELIFAVLCALTLATGFLLGLSSAVPDVVSTALYIAAYFFGGYYTLKEAIQTVMAKRFEIDFLMLVAAAGAAVLGDLAEGALLLALFSIGHALESYAMGRARRAIQALAELAPDTALVRRAGAEQEIPVGELRIGDTVIIKPNTRIPSDGYVTVGQSSVDQSAVTGESIPVDKTPIGQEASRKEADIPAESRIYAGTVNGPGVLEIEVTRLSKDSTLARVVRMVSEAQAQISPTQRFTDRFQRVFVPAVLILVLALLFAGLVIEEPFSATLYRAMAVLVAASPCALAISTPSAVLSGLARAARGGLLIKGGGPLENLGTLSAIAFDKTGTLTEGKPEMTDVEPAAGVKESELLSVALAVESQSDHPLASAIVTAARARLDGTPPLTAGAVTSITGRGVSALIDGEQIHIGKQQLFTETDGSPLTKDILDSTARLEAGGRTTMVVRRGSRYLGVLGLMDTPRDSAATVITQLRQAGIRHMIMLSGDNQTVAGAVAGKLGLDEARGDLLPEDKVKAVVELRGRENKVAMVGDGVNDAPAMANATVGIAMGAAGSDVAMETADVALMGDDLKRLPFAVNLSRQSSRIIRQNLWASLGVVAILIPATITGAIGIGLAVLIHEGSTLLVVANALRLLAYREPKT